LAGLLAWSSFPGRLQHHKTRGVHLDGRIGQHPLHGLMFGEVLAEGLTA